MQIEQTGSDQISL